MDEGYYVKQKSIFTYFRYFECLNMARMTNVWSAAQIDKGAATVNSSALLFDFFLQNSNLKLVVGEHLEQFVFA